MRLRRFLSPKTGRLQPGRIAAVWPCMENAGAAARNAPRGRAGKESLNAAYAAFFAGRRRAPAQDKLILNCGEL